MRDSLLACFALLLLTIIYKSARRRDRLPPGPKGLPILGNFWDMPARWEWLTYRKWGQDYGSDIISLQMFNSTVVVLNSFKVARELLDKRSAIYSDRTHQVMLLDLLGWSQNLGFFRYGDAWRDHKRVFHQQFYPGALSRYRDASTAHCQILLHRLCTSPEEFVNHIRAFGGGLILDVTYGIDSQWTHESYSQVMEQAVHSLIMSANAGSYAVDYFPLLRYLPSWAPGAKFKRDAAKWKKSVDAMFDDPFNFTKQSVVEGTLKRPSIASNLLADLEQGEGDVKSEAMIRIVTANAYIGGADTVSSALTWFVRAMVVHPEIQERAQAEIDRVIGSTRLPEHTDQDELPYLTAVMKETFRWHPVLPLGLAHRLMVDDEYLGYHLPAGSIVIGNLWAMLHDEDVYPNPDAFDPSRYLRADGTLNPDAPDPAEITFGFGRRICPGRYFAIEEVWLVVAQVLAVFNIEKAVDDAGNVVEPEWGYTSGLASLPIPFQARFKPRSDAAHALIDVPGEDE